MPQSCQTSETGLTVSVQGLCRKACLKAPELCVHWGDRQTMSSCRLHQYYWLPGSGQMSSSGNNFMEVPPGAWDRSTEMSQR
ncbi:hypothetical protein WJX84_008237 [Apatococcus fuscideae]|uniref:Uncharacterized protein n=1 Tax=Apatococcus fuscideae TaxID=2026836 RepID=A0AAW1TBK1_9CHLO